MTDHSSYPSSSPPIHGRGVIAHLFSLNGTVATLKDTFADLKNRYDQLPIAAFQNLHLRALCAIEFGEHPNARIPHLIRWLKTTSTHIQAAIESENIDGAGYGLFLADGKMQEAQHCLEDLTVAVEVHEDQHRILKLREELPHFFLALSQLQEARDYLKQQFEAVDPIVQDSIHVSVEDRRECELEFGLDIGVETPFEAALRELASRPFEAIMNGDAQAVEQILVDAKVWYDEIEEHLLNLQQIVEVLIEVQQETVGFHVDARAAWLGDVIRQSPRPMTPPAPEPVYWQPFLSARLQPGRPLPPASVDYTMADSRFRYGFLEYMSNNQDLAIQDEDSLPDIPAYDDFRYSTPRPASTENQEAENSLHWFNKHIFPPYVPMTPPPPQYLIDSMFATSPSNQDKAEETVTDKYPFQQVSQPPPPIQDPSERVRELLDEGIVVPLWLISVMVNPLSPITGGNGGFGIDVQFQMALEEFNMNKNSQKLPQPGRIHCQIHQHTRTSKTLC